ncbi:hypothetical protein IB276_34330 [Ensifer sp. ENS04]|uniref:ABC transporter substrate-binding protein n=1 Tax=Ensifer sp. ENS04 TaxID=2769281 RepID=UPI0017848EBF|nr:ABC transporter substrate-binding protein [Ensifer sp. ENS04]MBD9544518.1 hypothetical protein [Ensifer sp. ENS04]
MKNGVEEYSLCCSVVQILLGASLFYFISGNVENTAVAQAIQDGDTTASFELSRPLEQKPNFNWLATPAKVNGVYPARREHGARQVLFEPLFHLNLETGELEPWLGLSIEPDPAQKVWILKLRDGVTWSDRMPKKPGETEARRYPFTADDVVFTASLILNNPSLSAYEASRFRAAVENVEKVDNFTVRLTLRAPNPRFAIENFGDTPFGSLMIMPKHHWVNQNADTFAFDNPIGTGPYTLKEYTKEKVTYVLDSDWWGAKVGFELPGAEAQPDGTQPLVKLPEPAELVWRYTEPDETLSLLPRAGPGSPSGEEPQAVGEANAAPASPPVDWLDATRELSPEEAKRALDTAEGSIITWEKPDKPTWHTACARQLDINTQATILTEYTKPGEAVPVPVENAWSDPRLRKALAALIDRTALGRAYGFTDTSVDPPVTWFAASPSTTMFAAYGSMSPFTAAVESAGLSMFPEANSAAAEPLLADAGYVKNEDGRYAKDGKALAAKIAVIEGSPDAVAADTLKAQLDAVGIETTVDRQPNERYWGWAIPYGRYQMAYGWLSCGSLAEPYTSMKRYAYAPDAQNKDDPTFDNTGRWGVPTAYKDAVVAMANLPLKNAAGQTNPDLMKKMLEAYKVLNDEMPFIPLVQTPRIIAFSEVYWTGWPTGGNPGNPAHDWGSLHKVLQGLHKKQP